MSHGRRAGQELLTLQSGDTTFQAEMDAEPGSPAPSLWLGAELRLTGICQVQVDENSEPKAFGLLLRSPRDIRVVKQPSWWTAARALSALGIFAVSILATLAWAVVLRRRVHTQTEIIRERLEREASLEKRFQFVARATNDAV